MSASPNISAFSRACKPIKSSATAPFQQAASAKQERAKRPPPYSIRFTFEERATLERDAGKLSWSVYIRSKLFGEAASQRKASTRKRRKPSVDEAILGKLLGYLGKSRLASNMNQIAKAAHIGALPVSEELEEELFAACANIQAMRDDLIAALGLKPERKK